MKTGYKVFYSSIKREVVYEIEPSLKKRGKFLVTRNCSWDDQVYMSKWEAEDFIKDLKASGWIEAEL